MCNEIQPDFWISIGKYQKIETEKLSIWLSGVLCFENSKSDIVEFSTKFLDGKLDFNTVVGWFRIVIYTKKERKWYFFSDNSNSQHFYFDSRSNEFSDSFLLLRNRRGNDITPDYAGIGELFGLGFIAGENTAIKEIKCTDKDYFYVYNGITIIRESKKLKKLCELNFQLNVRSIIELLKGQIREKIAVVCTGGTDSRTIIGALMNSLGGGYLKLRNYRT